MNRSEDRAEAGDRILAVRNSHQGYHATVISVGDTRCTVRFDEGRKGKFVNHGDYRITERRARSGVVSDKDTETTKNESMIQKNNADDMFKVDMRTLVNQSIKKDAMEMAVKIAATTNDEKVAEQTIDNICTMIKNLTTELIESRRNDKSG